MLTIVLDQLRPSPIQLHYSWTFTDAYLIY